MKKSRAKKNKWNTDLAIDQLEMRAIGNILLQEKIKSLRSMPKLDMKNRSNREAYARAHVMTAHALYLAGRITNAEHCFFVSTPIMSLVHDARWTDGVYDDELAPVVTRLREIEKEHGIADDEFWPRNKGPKEYRRLNAQYDAILDKKCIETFREFGENEIADLFEFNRKQFDSKYERGRIAVFEKKDYKSGLLELVSHYQREARKCASAGSYDAACALLGAAMEAMLLLHCYNNISQAKEAFNQVDKSHSPKSKEPIDWSLNTLLEVCSSAGWLPLIEGEVASHRLEVWGHHIRKLRNLLHPGRHLKDRPRSIIGREEYEDALAAYTLISSKISENDK